MNKIYASIIAALMLCYGLGARADNIVTIGTAEGGPGNEVSVSIGLQNTDAVSSMQLQLPMPEGLTLVMGSASVSSRAKNHQVTAGVKDGILNIFVYSLEMAPVSGNNGEILTLRFLLGNTPTTMPLNASSVLLNDKDGNALNATTNAGSITVRAARGDYGERRIDFGHIPIRSTYHRTIPVTNTGNAPLVISGLDFAQADSFSTTTTFPFTVEPGGQSEIDVTFSPVERGTLQKEVRVLSNSVSRLNLVTIDADPFAVNELHIDNASGDSDESVTIRMRVNNMDALTGFQIEFDLPEQLKYVEGSAVLSERKSDHSLVATHKKGHLTLIAYSASGKTFSGEDGEIASFCVELKGRNRTELNASTAILTATYNGKDLDVCSAKYGGRVNIQSPQLSASDEMNLGATLITKTVAQAFTVQNNGNAPLVINRVVFDDNAFSVKETLPLTIQPWSSGTLNVSCASKEEKAFEHLMQIYSNDPEQRLWNVKIIGRRYAPNYLYVQTDDVFDSDNLKVHFLLDTYDNMSGLQFDLEYPSDYYEPLEEVLTTDRSRNLTVTKREISKNVLRYFCYSLNDAAITAGEGELFTLQFKPKDNNAKGQYNLRFSNIQFGTGEMTDKYAGAEINSSFNVLSLSDPLTITAKSYSRVYGEANPTFEYTNEGATLYGEPKIACEATITSPVGEYPITVTQGTVKNKNVAYVNGVLTITKAPLTITAKSYTMKQGDALPTFEAEYIGFKNNETQEVLLKQPVLTCSATSSSSPGTYDIIVEDAEAENYEISYVKGTLTITEADPVKITAKNYTREYGEPNPTFEYTVEGATLEGTPEIICEATATSPVGDYPIIIKKGSVTNYNDTYVNGVLTITKAPLTITAKSYTMKQGDALPTFEAEYSGFKNNESKDVLTKQASFSCKATSGSAPGKYDIEVSSAEAKNYEISYNKGTLTINEADPVTVTANSYTIAYGDAIPELGFTSSGAALNGKPTISCQATSTSPVGTYPIVISKGSVSNYNDTYVNGVLTITKAPLTITAKSYTMKQGDALPTFEAEYSGFRNNESKDVLTKQASFSCKATSGSAPGKYDIEVSGAEAKNYEISYNKGTLTINEAYPVTVTANSYTIAYGDAIPELGFTSSGAALNGKPAISCEATSTSPVGTYPIVISKGSVSNYNDTYVNGTLTITKAPLTVSVGNYTRKQGEENPEFSISYSGFKNNETEGVLTKKPTATTTATTSSEPGEYDILVSGAEAQNYNISYKNGKLTVVKADAIVITAKSYSREYGESNPTFEYTVDGAKLEGTPEIICEATATSPAGDYPIIIKKGSVTNYNDTYMNGVLTITRAPLTITAGSYTKKQYEPMPEFSVSFEGFKNNETEKVLSKQPVLSCEANEDSAPGEYDIVVSGAEAQNYEMKYVVGKLTVTEPDSYTLTYMVDGKEYKSFTVKYRESITPLEAPEKEGYTFSGWDGLPRSMPAKDVVVKGYFTINSYTITYVLDGEAYTTETLEYGAKVIPPVISGLEDYSIWEDVPETMPAKDITIYGKAKDIIDGISSSFSIDKFGIYDLQGRKQIKLQHGINIINGKKVMIK